MNSSKSGSGEQANSWQPNWDKMDLREKALNVFEKDYTAMSWANVLVVMLHAIQVDDGTAAGIGIFTEEMLAGGDKKGILGLTSDIRVGPNVVHGEMKQLNSFTVGAIYHVGEKI